MNLHRANGRPDWDHVPSVSQNTWQRTAASSHGVLTPGNGLTVAGLLIVFTGLYWLLKGEYWPAIVALTIGRSFDLLDGWAAEATGTKSPLGELFDAVSDKIGTVSTLGVAAAAHIAPWWLLLTLTLPHIIIAIISYLANRRGQRLHPSRIGKLSMAAAWVGLLGLIAIEAITASNSPVSLAVYVLCGLSIGMGLAAAVGYMKDSRVEN